MNIHEPLDMILSIYLSGYIMAFLTIKILLLDRTYDYKVGREEPMGFLPIAIVSLFSWIVPIYRLYIYLKYFGKKPL